MNKRILVLAYRGLKSPEIIRVKFAGISPDFSPGWGNIVVLVIVCFLDSVNPPTKVGVNE